MTLSLADVGLAAAIDHHIEIACGHGDGLVGEQVS